MKTRISRFLPVLLLAVACIMGASLSAYAAPSLEEPKTAPGADVIQEKDYATSKLTAPKLTSVKNISGGVKLTWSKSSGASGYIVLRALPSDKYFTRIKYVTSANTVTFTDKNVKSGQRYVYSVRAYTGVAPNNITSLSTYNTYGTYLYYLRRPKLTAIADSTSGITVTWRKEPTATGYIVYRRLSTSSSWSKLTKITKNTTVKLLDKTVVSGKTYHYRIRSYKGSNLSYVSTTKYIKHTSGSSNPVTYRALLVGLSKYNPSTWNLSNPRADNNSSNLYGPYYDVRVMNSMLKGMNYSSVTVKENIGKSQILSAISTAFSAADSNDVSLFYYSGHGATVSNSTYSGSLSMIGTQYYSQDISLSELATALSKVKGRVIVMLDSCGSGAGLHSYVGQVTAGSMDGDVQEEVFDPDKFNQSVINAFAEAEATAKYRELIKANKFYVLTASEVFEYSNDLTIGGQPGSAFTRGIVEGAGYRHGSSAYSGYMPADTNGNKAITLEEAYTYARARVNTLMSSFNESQHVLRYPSNSTLILYKR